MHTRQIGCNKNDKALSCTSADTENGLAGETSVAVLQKRRESPRYY